MSFADKHTRAKCHSCRHVEPRSRAGQVEQRSEPEGTGWLRLGWDELHATRLRDHILCLLSVEASARLQAWASLTHTQLSHFHNTTQHNTTQHPSSLQESYFGWWEVVQCLVMVWSERCGFGLCLTIASFEFWVMDLIHYHRVTACSVDLKCFFFFVSMNAFQFSDSCLLG